jgi:hypothetical protein
MKELVDWALENSGDEGRYNRRMITNPTLAKLGCLPQRITDISNQVQPWFCHGLAFRMATYSDDTDHLFERWETLLKIAQQGNGWEVEYKRWNGVDDHWAMKWDKFEQLIWLLQCYEYFSERGLTVSFPESNGGPDLLIEREEQEKLYAECYFYSKWWFREEYFTQLLWKIDKNLSIKRTHNVKVEPCKNPFSEGAPFIEAFSQLADSLTPVRLAELRVAAQERTPQIICEIGDVRFLLEGAGEYQPNFNAQGDPVYSFPNYVNEIINAKKDSNNLKGSRPNIVMANAMGLDFQLAFSKNSEQAPTISELPCSLDEVWISVCGFDGKLETCQRILKLRHQDYAGSSF